jgi:hypothetical protein
MQRLLFLLPVLFLSGCGIAARIQAGQEYRSSLEVYKTCLNDNPSAPQRCEGFRLAHEADRQQIDAMRPANTIRVIGAQE